MSRHCTLYVLAAMILGIVVGYVINPSVTEPATLQALAGALVIGSPVSMMYCAFAMVFIAQAYGIDLDWGQKITMLLLLMVTSKGMTSVPRASLVVIAATLVFFELPEAGLLLILAIDRFLDMGRSATNVVSGLSREKGERCQTPGCRPLV